jgi:hypothetical protein
MGSFLCWCDCIASFCRTGSTFRLVFLVSPIVGVVVGGFFFPVAVLAFPILVVVPCNLANFNLAREFLPVFEVECPRVVRQRKLGTHHLRTNP